VAEVAGLFLFFIFFYNFQQVEKQLIFDLIMLF